MSQLETTTKSSYNPPKNSPVMIDIPSPSKLVTLVNSNQVQPPIAPIGLEYLFEPLKRAGFEPE